MITAVSCAAQIGTAPLVTYFFGRLPIYFLLANYVVMPATVLILYLSLLCITILPFAPVVLLLSFTIECLNSFLAFVAGLPMSSIEGIHIDLWQLALVYAILVAVCLLSYLTFFRWHKHREYERFS